MVASVRQLARKLGEEFQKSYFGYFITGLGWDFVLVVLVTIDTCLPATRIFSKGLVMETFYGSVIISSLFLFISKTIVRQYVLDSSRDLKDALRDTRPTRNILIWHLRLENSAAAYGVVTFISALLAPFVDPEKFRAWGWIMFAVVMCGSVAAYGAQRMHSEVQNTVWQKTMYGSSFRTSVQLFWLLGVTAISFLLIVLIRGLK